MARGVPRSVLDGSLLLLVFNPFFEDELMMGGSELTSESGLLLVPEEPVLFLT